ncbi:MAG TPA: hypothetical protein VG963_29790 [Polyangiaceae bacterium]|nr:hypothetical protein [Polyangiaceae bacterium]
MARKLLDSPAALTSDGKLLVGASHLTGESADPEKVLARVLRSGRRVFIGVEMTKSEVAASMGRLDDALAEIVSLIAYRERG